MYVDMTIDYHKYLTSVNRRNTFTNAKDQPMHYGAAVKWSQKCPTLTNYFSMAFDQGVPKYCT